MTVVSSTIDQLTRTDDKVIIIDNNQVYFYTKVFITDNIEVLIPPITKHMNDKPHIDEVLFIPPDINMPIGLKITFTNSLNLRTITNPTPINGEIFVSNIIISIIEFNYSKISNSIIIKEFFRDLTPPDSDEILFKGSNKDVKGDIEDYINAVLKYTCDGYKNSRGNE